MVGRSSRGGASEHQTGTASYVFGVHIFQVLLALVTLAVVVLGSSSSIEALAAAFGSSSDACGLCSRVWAFVVAFRNVSHILM